MHRKTASSNLEVVENFVKEFVNNEGMFRIKCSITTKKILSEEEKSVLAISQQKIALLAM